MYILLHKNGTKLQINVKLLAPQSGTLSRISSGTRPSVQTLSNVAQNVPVRSILVHSAR